jgi:hypothetical protein
MIFLRLWGLRVEMVFDMTGGVGEDTRMSLFTLLRGASSPTERLSEARVKWRDFVSARLHQRDERKVFRLLRGEDELLAFLQSGEYFGDIEFRHGANGFMVVDVSNDGLRVCRLAKRARWDSQTDDNRAAIAVLLLLGADRSDIEVYGVASVITMIRSRYVREVARKSQPVTPSFEPLRNPYLLLPN